MKIDWDSTKAAENFRKHRVPFEEAATVFDQQVFRVSYDHAHSDEEDRWKATGMSDRLRLLTVVYTRRGDGLRIISAWKATARERREYAEIQDQT